MSTIRQKAKAVARPEKKIVKPVLTNALTIQWPELSIPAQAQIEASLWDVLKPLAVARAEQFRELVNDERLASPPEASTSKAILNPSGSNTANPDMQVESTILQPSHTTEAGSASHPENSAQPVAASKRAKHRARLRKNLEMRDAHLTPDMHELHLRSGKSVQISNRTHPEASIRKLRLDKRRAIKMRPAICDSLVIGLNAVTRYLEESVALRRRQLAGLPPSPVFPAESTAKNNLRLFIPAPNHGTRRDRRVLKERMHPDAKARKAKATRNNLLDNVPEMPPYLSVPQSDPALTCALQDICSRVSARQIPTPIETMLLSVVNQVLVCLESDDNGTASLAEGDNPMGEASTTSDNISLVDTDMVQMILGASGRVTDDRDRSILVSLLMRSDPEWFRIRNAREQAWGKIKTLERPGFSLPTQISSSVPSAPKKNMQLVFVAKADINPLQLVQHLLTSVAAHNSLNTAMRAVRNNENASDTAETGQQPLEDVYLVPLSKGAEEKLAGLLALRRVSVLAFTPNETPEYAKLLTLVQAHLPQLLSADWLIPATNHLLPVQIQHGNLVPTHLKHLQTTSPADVKAVRIEKQSERKRKRQTAQERTENKERAKKARPSFSDQSNSTSTQDPSVSVPVLQRSNLIATQPMP